MEPSFLSAAGGMAVLVALLLLINAIRKWLENRGVIERNDFGYYDLASAECGWCKGSVDPVEDFNSKVGYYVCDSCWTDYENSVR